MDKLLSILREIRPEHDFAASEDLIFDGLLDSFDIVTLVAKMEEGFGITIRGEDVQYNNFKNLKNIKRLIKRYLKSDEI
jgi:acyl carrier protein